MSFMTISESAVGTVSNRSAGGIGFRAMWQ